MSQMGHSRLGSAGRRCSNVRYAPKATVGHQNAIGRDGPKTEVGLCLDIKAFSRYDNGHNFPLVVAGAAVSIATNPTRANPG
jgi:hypothetical protein